MSHGSRVWSPAAFPEVVVYARGRLPVLERERIAGAIGRALQRFDLPARARVRVTTANCETGPMLIDLFAAWGLHIRNHPLGIVFTGLLIAGAACFWQPILGFFEGLARKQIDEAQTLEKSQGLRRVA